MTIAVVCGGVGAARFLRALALVWPAADTVGVVNTGDDTVLHGLSISPDLDTTSRPTRRWGPLRVLWWPYRTLLRHRSLLRRQHPVTDRPCSWSHCDQAWRTGSGRTSSSQRSSRSSTVT